MTTSSRPLRSDARRNREKIVTAAREAFAECGLPAQMEDIANRAGVGVGTLYRHFPTKDAIIEELVFEHMSGHAELARAALASDEDPWTAFSSWLWTCAQRHRDDRALGEVVVNKPSELFRSAAERSGLIDVTVELLERAKAAGAVRADATGQDVPLIMCGLGAVLQSSWGEDAWRRYFTIALDGLRARA